MILLRRVAIAWTFAMTSVALAPNAAEAQDKAIVPGGIWGKAEIRPERLEYEIELKTEMGLTDKTVKKTEKLKLSLYVVPLKKSGGAQMVYTLAPTDPAASFSGLSVGSLSLDKKFVPRSELSHPRDFLLNGALVRLFSAGQRAKAEQIEQQSAGKESIQLMGVSFRGKVPIKYEVLVSESGNEELEYSLSLAGDPVITDLGRTRLELRTLEQKFTFAPDTHEMTRGTWKHEILRHSGGKTRKQREEITFTQIQRRPLESEEIAKLTEEYKLLEPIARAVLPGRSASSQKDLLETQLASYKEKHTDGLLAGGLPILEAQLSQAMGRIQRPANPDVLADKLIGKPAPDFKLKDLLGNEVKLSDYKGKVVLVTFWGYI